MPDLRKPDPTVMLVCASLILTLSLGTRHSFGLFLQPMSMANGWGREVFGFAVAIQNLLWGLSQPVTGMLADRFGAKRVLFAGGLLFALGLVFMANSTTALGLTLAIGVFVGLVRPAMNTRPSANRRDRKSTRLNSSHLGLSYARFCF